VPKVQKAAAPEKIERLPATWEVFHATSRIVEFHIGDENYLRPKKASTARTMTTAPTNQMMLFMGSSFYMSAATGRFVITGLKAKNRCAATSTPVAVSGNPWA